MSKVGKIYMIPTIVADGTQKQVLSPEIVKKISELKFFAVENLRSARRFIRMVNKNSVIDEMDFRLLDKKTKESDITKIIEKLYLGEDIGVLSEAGCPGIADPGAKLVEQGHQNGIKVVPLVGPSSVVLALMASGMNGQSFVFHGYLPINESERKKAIAKLEQRAIQDDQTQIFMETPYRNNQMLENLVATCSNKIKLCVASNITSSDEYIETLPIGDWKNMKVDLHKKPTIFVLGK